MRRPTLTRNRLLTSIAALMVMASLSYNVIAEEKDVWKVIFDFQMKLAKQGNPSAQEKVGEMYEEGRGVKQDYDQARAWYSQAAKQDHKGAKDKLLGLNNRIRAKREREQQDSDDYRAEQERAIARQKAQQEREAQIKAARLQEARERAAREKAARQQATQNRTRLRQTANKEPKIRKETTGPQQASGRTPVKTSTTRQEEATASKRNADSLSTVNRVRSSEQPIQPTQANKPEKSTQDAGFKSDPCKSKAARFMSTCKNR